MPQIPVDPTTKEQFLSINFFPTITTWNRLEGRPRRHDFDRSLRAEVRDPLWMLCRQWQFGAFAGEDAGSAVGARVQLNTARINRFSGLDGHATAYDDRLPLEARVEREQPPLNMLTRAQMGSYWIKLISLIGDYTPIYLEAYPFAEPLPGSEAEHQLRSDLGAWSAFQLLKGRVPDGGKLYLAMTDPLDPHATWLAGMITDPSIRQALLDAAQSFLEWFNRTYSIPQAGEAKLWSDSQLEYRFACSAPAEGAGGRQTVLVASEYAHGLLDWYAFDIDPHSPGLQDTDGIEIPPLVLETRPPLSFLPAPITFGGAPNVRWWEFEDRKTDFGALKPSTTDLATLMLAEFGLIFSNDWSVIPYVLPLGTLSQVLGVVVKDVFGVRTLVRPASQTTGGERERWGMYDLSIYQQDTVIERLFLPPVIGKLQESEPIDKVILGRDEMANMTWGVEHTIPSLVSGGTNGFEAAKALQRYLSSLTLDGVEEEMLDTGARIRYKLGRSVPENWIPFIPVQTSEQNPEIRLQRAAMPRLIPGTPDIPVEPRTAFLRTGLDQAPPLSFFIQEEEVPKAGVVLMRTYQRTRWYDGKVVTWIGRRKSTGLGQGSSGLLWDRIEPIENSNG